MPNEPTVFVVDDDELARKSVCLLVRSMGVRAESFASAEEFLDEYVEGRSGCLVTDVRMLGMSGLDLQEMLCRQGIDLPVIVLSHEGSVPTAVRALRAGAIDFVEKPFVPQVLVRQVRKAVRQILRPAATTRHQGTRP